MFFEYYVSHYMEEARRGRKSNLEELGWLELVKRMFQRNKR